MNVDDKITRILEQHGEGSGSEPGELDDKVEGELSVLSKIKDKKESDGPVPEELKPYTKESAFAQGFERTMKLAGLGKFAANIRRAGLMDKLKSMLSGTEIPATLRAGVDPALIRQTNGSLRGTSHSLQKARRAAGQPAIPNPSEAVDLQSMQRSQLAELAGY